MKRDTQETQHILAQLIHVRGNMCQRTIIGSDGRGRTRTDTFGLSATEKSVQTGEFREISQPVGVRLGLVFHIKRVLTIFFYPRWAKSRSSQLSSGYIIIRVLSFKQFRKRSSCAFFRTPINKTSSQQRCHSTMIQLAAVCCRTCLLYTSPSPRD